MITGEQIVAKAKSLIGVSYRHVGRNRMGVDCAGLLVVVYTSLENTSYTEDSYNSVINSHRFVAGIEQYHRKVLFTEQIEPGDVLLFQVGGQPQHVGFVSEWIGGRPPESAKFIHAHQSQGRVLEQRLSDGWYERIVEVYRWNQGS